MENETTVRVDSHLNNGLFARYHVDVHMPADLLARAYLALPKPGTELILSGHYDRIRAARGLPRSLRMPSNYWVVDIMVERASGEIGRVMVRTPWTTKKRKARPFDAIIVLEANRPEVVTMYWVRRGVGNTGLDMTTYEQPPPEEGGEQMLAAAIDDLLLTVEEAA